MIEVLIAVVVLAIGLLAGSKMQMLGLNYTQGAMMRSHATMAVNDIIDRMRVNPEGVALGSYDTFSSDSPPGAQACGAAGCTAAQLAQHDLRIFASYFGKAEGDGLAIAISEATGSISAADVNGIRTVAVTWSEMVEGDVDDTRNISVGVFLP